MFRRKKWKYLILDEAHMIKNWKSQRWQTLLNFNSKRRLLITGTQPLISNEFSPSNVHVDFLTKVFQKPNPLLDSCALYHLQAAAIILTLELCLQCKLIMRAQFVEPIY